MESGRLGPRAGARSPTAVLAALPEEVAGVVARLEGRVERMLERQGEGRPRGVTEGFVGEEALVIMVTGDGALNARSGAAALLGAVPVGRLIAIGVAGGLSSGLRAGELIMAREVVGESGCRFCSSVAAPAARAAGARLGTVYTAGHLILESEDKRRLGEAVLPGREAGVVDLESAHFAAVAEEAGVPWLVIRAVSDTAEEDLPRFLAACAGPEGEIRRGEVLRHAARHPSAIPGLLRMRRRIELCGRALASAVEGVLHAPWGAPVEMAGS